MNFLKNRMNLLIQGLIVSIITCVLCLVFIDIIPSIVISILMMIILSLVQEYQKHTSNKSYNFDWENVLSVMVGGILGVSFTILICILK